MQFPIEPNVTLPFTFVEYGQTEKRVVTTDFPANEGGVYVLRHVAKDYPRLQGSSSVLRIGESGVGFQYRFRTYNNKSYGTCSQHKSLSTLAKLCSKNHSSFRLMWLLRRLSEIAPIEIDFYFSDSPKTLQTQFGLLFIDRHWEVPPLNSGLS